jgi:predicted RNA-binding protein
MGGITQTLTGANMTDYFQSSRKSLVEHMKDDFDPRLENPATLRDLHTALIRIEIKFDSLRNYIDSQAFKTTQK